MALTDRPVALVTMADSYVGPALATTMATRGFDLVLQVAGDTVPLDAMERIEAAGASVLIVAGTGSDGGGDLSTEAGNRSLVAHALDRFGRIDSACLITGTIVVGKFLDMTQRQWDRVKRTNLDMVFHGLQAVLPPMIEVGAGQVVVFTSATGGRPGPMASIYGATRAGANGLVRAVGLEHAADGVQVNAIGTNFMDFAGFLQASGADTDPERRARIEAQTPMRRLGSLDELAAFTAVLLDGSNRFQTGQFFDFSGGWGA